MKCLKLALIIFLTLFSQVVTAEKVQKITWEDLIPKNMKSKGLLADLDKDQRDMVYWVIRTLENLPPRTPENKDAYEEVDSVLPMLKKLHVDIEKVMVNRNEIRNAVVKSLNGKNVRLAGYLLPLESTGKKVTEFLLVPYVGACIHVPPPPPNQIVHVNMTSKKGYRNKKLFEPVWVTGTLTIKTLVKALYLQDGSADITTGYTLQAVGVAPYKE